MRKLGSLGFAVFLAVLPSAAMSQGPPPAPATPVAAPEGITNPNATPAPPQAQQSVVMFDVKKIAATTRPAVALVTVFDKSGKPLKLGTGFFISPDGKLVTNAHVIESADTATAKLENGATYSIRGVLKAALDKDLVLLQADAKDVPSLTISRETSLPAVGSRVAVIGSPLGLEGTVSEGIISGHRNAKKDDQLLQITAAVSPGSSGSPVVDENGQVVGIATFLINNAQALNFARPVAYVSELLDQSKSTTEVAPFWTVTANPKNVVLNDPDFVAAENALQKDDAAGALKLLNGIATKYSENGAFLFKLGAVYERLNLLDDAVQAYQHALKLEPTSGIGWTSLGSTLSKLRRFADAKEAARQAVKQSPDYGPAWALLGKLYSDESRYADAADAFQKAAQLMPKDAEFWRSLAESYSKMNEPTKSQEAIQKSQEITGNAPIAYASPVSVPGKDKYTDFVTTTLRETEQGDINNLMSSYADKVVYRGYGIVDKAFVRKASLHPIADALDATHKELADTARTSILQAVTNAAKLVAKKPGLDVSTVAQLRDLALALVRLCDNGKPAVTVYSDKTMIVCDEKRRAELIQQRERLLEAESQGKVIELNGKSDGEAVGRKTEAAVPVTLPVQDTHSNANVGAVNGTVTQNQRPTAKQDPLSQWRDSVGRAATWKTSEPENHGGGGSFGPYPEEYE